MADSNEEDEETIDFAGAMFGFSFTWQESWSYFAWHRWESAFVPNISIYRDT